jgi:hypothetical protein
VNQYTPPLERFYASAEPVPFAGCWLWTGWTIPGRNGDDRPRMRLNGRLVYAYRFAYEALVGPIPEGALVCHRCDVSICVNPDHLYLGNEKTNAADAVARGRHTAQKYPDAAIERGRKLGRYVRGVK